MTREISSSRTIGLAMLASACATEHAVVAALASGGSAGTNAALGGAFVSAGKASREDASLLGGGAGNAGSAGQVPAFGAGTGGTQNTGGAPVSPSEAGTGGSDMVVIVGANRAGAGGAGGQSSGGVEYAGFGGESGMLGEPLCTCLGQSAWVCSNDGVTHDVAVCDETCPFIVACLHECPCSVTEPEPANPSIWFTDAVAGMQCSNGHVCVGPASSTIEPGAP